MRVLLIVVVLGLGACSSQSSYAGAEERNMGSEYRTCLHYLFALDDLVRSTADVESIRHSPAIRYRYQLKIDSFRLLAEYAL
jgi:hypothetical protein